MRQKLEYVNPKDCEVDDMNVRDGYVAEPELEASIKAQGIIEPLVYREVKGKKKKQIVCGGRRLTAAIAVKLKEVPVLKRELNDEAAIALSLQENMERSNLSILEEEQAINKIWDLVNGGRSDTEKLEYIGRQLGIGKRHVQRYRAINRFSEPLKKKFFSKNALRSSVDAHTGETISSVKQWNEKEKGDALEIASKQQNQKDRIKVVKELKEKAKEGIAPKEAYEEIKKRPEGKTYSVYLSYELKEKFQKWCDKNSKDHQTAIALAVERMVK